MCVFHKSALLNRHYCCLKLCAPISTCLKAHLQVLLETSEM